MEYNIIIKNGKIIDGAGNPWFRADIGIKEGFIKKIRPNLNEDADKVVDASGLVVCPGFIDAHSHTDYPLILGHQFTRVDSFVRQGITTCVIGMCGDGVAPIPEEKKEEAIKRIKKATGLSLDIDLPWNTYEEYIKKLEQEKLFQKYRIDLLDLEVSKPFINPMIKFFHQRVRRQI